MYGEETNAFRKFHRLLPVGAGKSPEHSAARSSGAPACPAAGVGALPSLRRQSQRKEKNKKRANLPILAGELKNWATVEL